MSINEKTTWYYFFSAIMQTYGTIISILVFVAIYAIGINNINIDEKKYILLELFWLFTLGIFIIIISFALLYYTEHIWQLATENVKYLNLNYKNSLLIIVICLCVFYLFSMVFFLRELIEKVGFPIPFKSKELLVLFSSIIGFFLGILINIVKFVVALI